MDKKFSNKIKFELNSKNDVGTIFCSILYAEEYKSPNMITWANIDSRVTNSYSWIEIYDQ